MRWRRSGRGGGSGGGTDAAAKAAAAIAVTPTDLMRYRSRYLNFLECSFHYSLEIIIRNLNNQFLTSDISLKATF